MSTKEQAPKKRASKKVSAKKITKKVSKKSAPRKTTKKRTVKKTVGTSRKKPVVKLKKQEQKTASKALAKANLFAGQGLLVLSPFRFPLDIDKLAVNTARFGGVFFVLIGAIFTVLHANYLFSGASVSQLTASTIDSGTVSISDGSESTNTQSAGKLIADYSVTFNYDKSDPVTGTANRIKITTVSSPKEVWLQAKNISTSQVVKLGRMTSLGNETWEFVADTTILDDGQYRFQAVARYLDVNGVSYNVNINDTASRTVSNFLPAFKTVIQAYNRDLSGTERIVISSDEPNGIKLYLEDESGKIIAELGEADLVSETDWVAYIDTTRYQNGAYQIKAKAIWLTYSESSQLLVKINNQDDSSSSTDVASDDTDLAPPSTIDQTEEVVDSTEAEMKSDTEPITVDKVTDPDITISIVSSEPIAGLAKINISVDQADFIELYIQPKSTGLQRYLGQATKISSGKWIYSFDSANVPNGEYQIYAKVKNRYGVFTAASDWKKIYNLVKTVSDQSDIDYRDSLTSLDSEVKINTEAAFAESRDLESFTPEQQLDQLVASQNETSAEDTEAFKLIFNSLIEAYQAELEDALQALATAYRSNDQYNIETAKNRINRIVAEVTNSALSETVTEEIIRRTNERIQYLTERVKTDVERTNSIIAERTGQSAELDTDKDGITDFDEIAIYKTDPFVADSDNDGFTDGAEILSGYDPTDSTPEVAVAYESPQEAGVIREDILAVYSISTENFSEQDIATSTSPKRDQTALITGQALPNSYVTLYVFSTPVIVTVRADSDGSWFYRFDKELEDGEHQIYVGITDNSGKLIAKSRPLNFVKQAEAYTQIDEPLVPGVVDSGGEAGSAFSMLSLLLLVASISVVSIGLVLILLGWYIDNQKKNNLLQPHHPTLA